MTRDELIERMARAMCRAWFYCDLDRPDGLDHWRKTAERYRTEATAALTELEKHAVVAPREIKKVL